MALTVTVEYITEADADIHFGEKTNTSVWDNTASPDKVKALKEATRLIDDLNFVGEKNDPINQVREFPRNDDVVVPEEVQRATAEVAIALLAGTTLTSLNSTVGKTAESIGDASVSYDSGGRQRVLATNLGLVSPEAARLLREWIIDPREIEFERVG